MSAPSEIAAILAEHRRPGEFLTAFGDTAWLVCSCGERITLPVRDGKVFGAEAESLFEAHQTVALAALAGSVVPRERA